MKKLTLPLLLCASLIVTGCGPKKFIAIADHTRNQITSSDVHMVKANDEMTAEVVLMQKPATQGCDPWVGLIGNVVTSVVNANRQAAARKALQQVQSYMGTINVNEVLQARLTTAVKNTPWLKAKHFYHERNMTDTRLRQMVLTSPADTVLVTEFSYTMVPDFSAIAGTLKASLYASRDGLGADGKVKRGTPLYRTEVESKINLTGGRNDLAQNAQLWEQYGPNHMHDAMTRLIENAVNNLHNDLLTPGRVH